MGYGKPPPQHRFKKGQSGNPNGRRRRKLNEAELLAKVRDELIPITMNGKTRLVTFAEVAFRKTHMAVLAKGSVNDLEKLVKLRPAATAAIATTSRSTCTSASETVAVGLPGHCP